ncbi:MAG TPA: hypothetical protein VKQ30_07740 [Ktedonobacterales bacterium]|nr:hypothetical protein [Ktedonobacterales bacterium]
MLQLSLAWLSVGVVVGVLASVARLRPETWGRRGWLWMLALGAAAGLVGGWLGALVYGRYFGLATALWIAVLAVAMGPRAVRWVQAHIS